MKNSWTEHVEKKTTIIIYNLESDVALDADIGALDVRTIKWHVDVGSPGIVIPFNIQTIVRLQGGGQGVVVTKGSFPLNRNVTIVVDGRRNAVGIVDLLGNGNFLVVSRSGQLEVGVIHLVIDSNFLAIGRRGKLNIGVIHLVLDVDFLAVGRSSELDIGATVVVTDHNVGFFGIHIVSGVQGHSGTINIHALGSLDLVHIQSVSSRSRHTKRKIGILVVSIQLKCGRAAVLSIDIGTGRDSPSADIGGCLTPDVAGKGGNVRGRSDSRFNTVIDIDITGLGGTFPVEGGVKSIKAIEVSVADRNLVER